MSPLKTKVGLFGGSGIIGSELIRWIHGHPKLELTFVHSRHHAGEALSKVHPYLEGMSDLRFSGDAPESLVGSVDAIFMALGHGEARALCDELAEYRGVIIDLTMDHRISDTFRYGIPEIHRRELSGAKRIANPGCFATAAILAAVPFLKSKLVEDTVFVSAVTGSSGAGIKPVATTHHPFREGNLFAYKLFHHQHEPEIQHVLGEGREGHPNVILTAHSGPFVRGIHSTTYLRAKENHSEEKWRETLSRFYEGSSFVRVRPEPPSLKNVVGSNFCDIHVGSRGKDMVVISVLDNLVKGAAGQAIQNLNLAMGWDEKEGLWTPPVFP